MSDVLDFNYIPSNQHEPDLLDKKQKYMYAMFEKTLMTDKDKALVWMNQHHYNAQQIYKVLKIMPCL